MSYCNTDTAYALVNSNTLEKVVCCCSQIFFFVVQCEQLYACMRDWTLYFHPRTFVVIVTGLSSTAWWLMDGLVRFTRSNAHFGISFLIPLICFSAKQKLKEAQACTMKMSDYVYPFQHNDTLSLSLYGHTGISISNIHIV